MASELGLGEQVVVRNEALSDISASTVFWQVDQSKYENPGAGSFFELNFNNRSKFDPKKGLGPVQSPVTVPMRRFDELGILTPQLLVMDVQGFELKVLQGFGAALSGVLYVVLEAEPVSSYVGGCTLSEILRFMTASGFHLVGSDRTGPGILRLRRHLFLRCIKTAIDEKTISPKKVHQGIINLAFARVKRQ